MYLVCPTCRVAIIFEKTDASENVIEGSGTALYPQTIPFGLDEGMFGSVQFSLGLTCAHEKEEEHEQVCVDCGKDAKATAKGGGESKQENGVLITYDGEECGEWRV